MSTSAIRQKLHRYIDTAQDKKVKAIFAMVEDEIEKDELIWTDEFLANLNKRSAEFDNGETKGTSWENVKKKAKRLAKSS